MKVWLWGILLWVMLSSVVQAHPLDELHQITYVLLSPDHITLRLELYPGLAIAPQFLGELDANHDDTISEAERAAYLEYLLADITLTINGESVPLQITNSIIPSAVEIRAGVAVLGVEFQADVPIAPDSYAAVYHNQHLPDISTYLITTMSTDALQISLTAQMPNPEQTALQFEYVIKAPAPTPPPAPTPTPAFPENPGCGVWLWLGLAIGCRRVLLTRS